ncbi:MAG: hypothetical protein CME70_09080 [Halobacteriovorax sp.]|nr:hypothetical protein [Halobacteriovorax sp.]
MRSSLSYPFIFLASFLAFILIFALKYPVDHHAYIRIVEQNIANCSNWECFRQSAFTHNMRGSLFIHYLFDMVNRWQGGINALVPNLVASAFFNAFFVLGLFYHLMDKIKDNRHRLLWFTGFFLAFPLMIVQLFTIEDNITYYGFFTFYLYFLINDKFGNIIDGALSGVFLGFAIWMHISPFVFLFLIALVPFSRWLPNISGKKITISVLLALATYYFFHIATHFSHFWHGSFSLAFEQVPLHRYLEKAVSLEQGARAEGLSYFQALLIGFENMNYSEGIRILGYLAWINLIILLGLNFKTFKDNILIIFIGAIALSPVVLYEPEFSERWDFFLITLFIFLLNNRTVLNFTSLLLIFVCLQSVNTGAMLVHASPITNSKAQFLVEFKELYNKYKNNDYFIFEKRFLRIDPFIISHFPKKEENIYFSDGKKFYQTNFSLIAKGIISRDELWNNIHFDAWSAKQAIPEPKGIQEVSDGCDIVKKEKVYISETLIESIKRNCP